MGLNGARNYRGFIKSKEAMREDAAKLQRQGRSSASLEAKITEPKDKGNPLDLKTGQDRQQEKQQPAQQGLKTELRQEKAPELQENLEREKDGKQRPDARQRANRRDEARHNMEHDMCDQALGQIYRVPGADIDYDEIRRMSQNGIRDASELASESLQNDGYHVDQAADIAAGVMEGFLKGEKSPEDVRELCSKYSAWDVATAYTSVAKQMSVRDADRMDRIGDLCNFERPAFERAFMVIRDNDRTADEAMERLELILGRERER